MSMVSISCNNKNSKSKIFPVDNININNVGNMEFISVIFAGELPPLQKPCEVHGRENRLDAVVMMNSGTVYGFRENTYFPITEAGKPEPLPITDWEGLIGKIDAAVSISPKYNRTMRDGEITRELIEGESLLVFQGSRVFKFNVEDKSLAPGYPQEIRDVFPGLPTNIDSAFTWSGNGKLYVTKGKTTLQYHNQNILQLTMKYITNRTI